MEKTWWDRVIAFNRKHGKDMSKSQSTFRAVLHAFAPKFPIEWMDILNTLDEKDLLRLILILNIESQIKQNKIMGQIEDILQSEQDENAALKALAEGVTKLSSALTSAQNQLGALQTQLNNGTAVSKDQLKSLADGIASGRQIATEALEQAEAALASQSTSDTSAGEDTVHG